ncbi:TRAP transporter small permease [Marinobacterium aestuariivivens]|uniref:TRAP transporter small permease protein n=1 Tax=Marinobacterium aestuariivivens TaxID=1698799 RepID=A0ABW2AA12_9GAMM
MKIINQKLQCVLAIVGGSSLVAMLLVAVSDIISRLIGYSFSGAYEVIGWLSATAIGCSLGYTQMHKGHVKIDFISGIRNEVVKSLVSFVVLLASFYLASLVGFQLIKYAFLIYKVGSLSETLMWPVYPWVFLLAFAFFTFAFSFLTELFYEVLNMVRLVKVKFSRKAELNIIPNEECGL